MSRYSKPQEASTSTPFDEEQKNDVTLSIAPPIAPSKFILVTCRPCKVEENHELGKHFSNIISYNPQLYSGHCDLSKMSFDLLIIDAQQHLGFLEIITPQAKAAGIPIVVLKRPFCGSSDLVCALGSRVIKEIVHYETKTDFVNYLLKDKLPRLENRLLNLAKRVFQKLCSS